MNRLALLALVLVGGLVVVGCSSAPAEESKPDPNVSGRSIKEAAGAPGGGSAAPAGAAPSAQ